jgi:hypothetical protein
MLTPVFEIYGDEARTVFGSDADFVQSTHFVLAPTVGRLEILPKLLLFREVFRAAVVQRARYVITVIRDKASYVSFYRRLGFEVIASGRVHPTFAVPTVLLAAEITATGFHRVLATERFFPIFQGLLPNCREHRGSQPDLLRM